MQKQEVTILSAELSGFQSLVESLTPEEITPMMNEVHALVENTARLHQGKINRYTGDTFLAVFNTSKTAVKNALESAFELKDQLISFTLEKKLNLPFKLKFGIATGGIIVTEIGDEQKQQTLMGKAVNHATRISQFAEEGQILADDKTIEDLADDFEFQKLEPIPLKGGTEPLPVFELLGRKRKKLDLKVSGERKIASEMVGRSREMEQLDSLFNQLVAGKGSVVNIVGKAGIGKSRLMAEMKVQPIMEKVLLLEGRALSTGKNLSFHPIIHLIKSWAEITEDDLPAVSTEKLQKGIQQIAPDQADEIYAFMATMMGLPLSVKHSDRIKGIEGEALEKLILKNLRDLIISATKEKPRIYLIEDMHWSDNSSIAFFESLYKLSQKYPVMFINVLRPGYKDTGDYILKYLVDNFPGDHITLNVSPLETKDSRLLICNLVHNIKLPEEIKEMIIRKSEGNPFFIEEIIRSFLDDGIIEIHDKDFRIAEKIKNINIPETINEVILSRVDKLDEKTKELLKTASVIGRNFYFKVLEEAADTIGELDSRLEYLKDVQLIGESKKKDEIEYLFKHALAQQATYESILLDSKKELHLKIARSIEKVFSENLNEFYGTLAYHYTKANNKEKTIQYLVLAGDESMNSGASSEAINFYLDAMELLPQERKQDPKDKEIRKLSIKIAVVYHTLGKNALAIENYEMIIKKYFNFKFPRSEKALLLNGIFYMLLFKFIINNQFLFFKRTIDGETDVLMKLFNDWGYAYIHVNPKHFALKGMKTLVFMCLHNVSQSKLGIAFFIDYSILFNFTGISLKTAQKMIDFAQRAGVENNRQAFINFRMIQSIQNYFSGKWAAESDFEDTYNEGLKMGKYWTTITYIYYTGMCAIESGNYKDFLKRVELLEEYAESLDITYSKILTYRLTTMGYLKFRKLDELREISEASIDFIKTTGDDANLFMVYCMRAQGCMYLGKTNEARDALGIVDKKVDKHKRIPIFYSQYLLSHLEFQFHKLEEAINTGNKITAIMREFNKLLDNFLITSKKNIASLSTAYLMKARLSQIQKRKGKPFKYLKKALISGEKYDGNLELSRAYFETGKFLNDPKVKYKKLNGNPGSYYLEKAKIMFKEMDLHWDLEQYQEFLTNKN